MKSETLIDRSNEIFSFHLIDCSSLSSLGYLTQSLQMRGIRGLKHSECFYVMNLGHSVLSLRRFDRQSFSFFLWWQNEEALDLFLKNPDYANFENRGWHVRMKPYRRWGVVKEIEEATIHSRSNEPQGPIVAVTLARLRISQTLRFIKWGRPVEAQVRDHTGKSLALAAMRPLNTFCTFSIWQSEQEMIGMVNGNDVEHDREDHKRAMFERNRNPFHYEFTTMRFWPIREFGEWRGRTCYLQ